MSLIRHTITALLMTIVTTVLLGLIYPMAVTLIAQLAFFDKANGSLVSRNGQVVGSPLLGQTFTSPRYFHGRPSAAGSGYDAANSSGTNLGPTSKKLIDAVSASVKAAQAENPGVPVPVDLVTSSGSGLDPHVSPAAALFQVPRVARERHAPEAIIRGLVESKIEGRQFGFLGEPRVNVLLLNLALDDQFPVRR
jgi:potassium-transporting ATPase KdpC subunit